MLEDLKEKAGELRSKEVELKERELAVVRRQVCKNSKNPYRPRGKISTILAARG